MAQTLSEKLIAHAAGIASFVIGVAAVPACEPIPPHLLQMIRDGGMLAHLAKGLERSGKGLGA